VRVLYDWAVIYRRYQELWAELDARRVRAGGDDPGAPRAAPHWRDTFRAFASFPTRRLGLETSVQAMVPDGAARHAILVAQPLWSRWIVPQATVERVFAALAGGPQSVGALARAVQADGTDMVHIAAILAKMQLVELDPVQSSTIAESSRP
jgi:hypothetical protein